MRKSMIYLLQLLLVFPLSEPSNTPAGSLLLDPKAGDTLAMLIQMASPERLN